MGTRMLALGDAMALGNDGFRPDAAELWVRFACGALGGAFLVAGIYWSRSSSSVGLLLCILGGGLAGGLLARYFGDRFWSWLTWPRRRK
jgi:hypothetical protein